MADNTKYDIAVIGGGLAGLSLAIQSINHGYKVILFEKERYPYHKVCGEYISLESRPFIESLGVPLQQMNLPLIKKLEISDVHGRLYDFKLPLGGFGVSRYHLDNLLYRIALKKGVDVRTETKVFQADLSDEEFMIKTSAGDFTSKITAGCFGKRSNIDVNMNRPFLREKSNGLNNYIGVKYHINYRNDSDTIALHNFENGYCGISKVEDNKSCLCYLTTEENLKKSGNSINEMERKILQKNPFLNEIFNEAEFIFSKPVTISKVSFNKKQQVENRILMIGDSAGMITPLCGNGMSMALHASKLAFNAIHLFLREKIDRTPMEEMYKQTWNKEFAMRLKIGRMVQRVFGGNTTTSLFLKAMNTTSPLSQLLIKSTHGRPF